MKVLVPVPPLMFSTLVAVTLLLPPAVTSILPPEKKVKVRLLVTALKSSVSLLPPVPASETTSVP
ncbi:MAG: hypothetical protein K0R03_7 [Moraxellaceae bacterium]|nr:hypothetical protein [Moraxellaceae bacterium]